MTSITKRTLLYGAGLAYFFAFVHRSSLGIASLVASERFHTDAQQLSLLAVLQLVVYASMQIPVGILLDRFGPKRLLATGAIVMAAGQLLVAFSANLSSAIAGRMFVGLGDAFTFISMIRVINTFYVGGLAAKRQQLFANLGQLGQLFSAIPFGFMLRSIGWQPAFSVLSTCSLMVFVLLISARVQNSDSQVHKKVSFADAIKQLRENSKTPAVRMAFWTHFSTQSSGTAFALLWAVPFFVSAQGQSTQFAALMLSLQVGMNLLIGPVIGHLCAHYPQHRSRLVYAVVGNIVIAWLAVILWPGTSPVALLVYLMFALTAGGPASGIAFDFTRTYVPLNRLGTANGFTNVGGFLASFSMMYLMGLVLDGVNNFNWFGARGLDRYGLAGFKWAISIQFVVIAIGIAFFAREARRVHAATNAGNS